MAVLVVTGGSRGIGAEICRLAATQGWDVCVNYANEAAEADHVANQVHSRGRRAMVVQADVSRKDQVEQMFEAVERELGVPSGLVNNAGIMGSSGTFDALDIDKTRRMFEINLFGAFLCCRAAILKMARRHGGKGGAIVNISSAASRHGGIGSYIDFAVAKAALDRLTTALAIEQAPEGIRINCVRPGFIMTDGNRDWMRDHPGWMESVVARTPIGHPGELGDAARATLWLLSSEAQFVTGAILDVSGGLSTP